MTPIPGHRAARLFDEAPKAGHDRRSPFARDRGRVLHSAALRRLAGKTQVVGPGEDAEVTGVPRTRLTHSLEVAQIGRGIAEDLGVDPDVVDTAGLAHDIGHPPFGHNGERALHALSPGCGGFESNAQTLRILTRLEPKVLDDERCRGLNLTRAVLDACVKYPWSAGPGGASGATGKSDVRKFGVYDDDAEVFAWIREGAPPRRRCVEAQIMDWSDDVAYSVHDLEDGILAGRIVLSWLSDPGERAEIAQLAAGSFAAGPTEALKAAAATLAALPSVRAAGEHDGSLAAMAALKRLTSDLVGRFVTAAVEATRDRYGERDLTGHDADLVVPDTVRAEVSVLKAAALRWVMRDPARLALQARQRDVITELVERLDADAPRALDPAFVPAWEAATDDDARRRVVVDQVAVLTDAQAGTWCARLREAQGGRAPRSRTVDPVARR